MAAPPVLTASPPSSGFSRAQPISPNLPTRSSSPASSSPRAVLPLDPSRCASAGLLRTPFLHRKTKATTKQKRVGGNGTPIWVSNGTRWTSGQWIDTSAQVEAAVPLSLAWDLWSDKEGVNRWMPWIHSIKVSKDNPQLSEWVLKYNAFGRDFEFKWTAKNLQPIYHQKLHWKSMDGLKNRGTVRFYPRGTSSVTVQLIISYEVPDVLAPLVVSVSPLVESILQKDLERFAIFAKEYSQNAAPPS